MMPTLGARLANNRKFLPLGATVTLFVLALLAGMLFFPGMRDAQ
jgi:hypothetical protein